MKRILWTIENENRYNLFVDGIKVGHNLTLNDFFAMLKRYEV